MLDKYFGFRNVSFKKYLAFAASFLLVTYGLFWFQQNFTISVNLSHSLPQTFFIVSKEKPTSLSRGDLVQFEYKSYSGKMVFPDGIGMVKFVKGVPGDEVVFKGNQFFINGVFLGTAKDVSTKGLPLTRNKNRILKEGEFFMFTPNSDSFDSRYAYVGYVKQPQIYGKVVFSL